MATALDPTAGAARRGPDEPLAVILAGGEARRMGGGDKGLIEIGGKSLLAHALERLTPQITGGAAAIALNANGDPARFADLGLPVLADPVPGRLGPLAGVLAGLDWAAENGAAAIVTIAADTPFFPRDLVARLTAAALTTADLAGAAPLAMAETGGRAHPTFGYWPAALRGDLAAALTKDGVRKVVAWTDRHGCASAAFDDCVLDPGDGGPAIDPFFNINRPEDVALAERAAAALSIGAER